MSKIPSAVTYGTKYIAYKKIYDIAKTQNDKFLLETKKIICKNLCSSFWHQLYYDSRRKYVSDKEAREFLNSNFELLDAKQKAMTIFERIIPSIVKIIRRIALSAIGYLGILKILKNETLDYLLGSIVKRK